MDSRRLILAVALSAAVMFAMQYIFPFGKQQPNARARASIDSVARAKGTSSDSSSASRVATQLAAPTSTSSTASSMVGSVPSVGASADSAQRTAPPVAPIAAETAVVVARKDSGATFHLSNVGAAPVSVVMNAYDNRIVGGKVDLGSPGRSLLKYQLVTNNNSKPIDLGTTAFQESRAGNVVTYQAPVDGSTLTIQYAIAADSFVAHVTGSIAGAPATGTGDYLLVNLPQTFAATEPDTADDRNYLAYAFLSKREAARNVLFRSLDPGEKQLVEGPLTWIVAKSKYFVVGLLAPKNGPGFTEATLVGGPRTTKIATQATGTVVVPINKGSFAFDLYAGPQAWQRLNAQGRSFDEVNPYGWAFVRGIMQPIATSVIRVVLWMHRELKLSYGLVLIALGLIVRLLMWPLYQSSMRTSLKMQVLQPELQAVQDKYKDDPEKQRTEVMKVYQSHGMNPLSPLLGCLPSLLPMPILFALFFVFRNTIELRGVPFLWMSDLSAHDPFYILPLIMGLSMYLVSWIGMRGAPPNPQTKMMSYAMPVMFTFFFYRAAAGLNLYYATQNLATLPQQWHLAHERVKMGTKAPVASKTGGGAKGSIAKVKTK